MKNKSTTKEVMSDIIISDEMVKQLFKNNSSSRIPLFNNEYEISHKHWKPTGRRITMSQQQPSVLSIVTKQLIKEIERIANSAYLNLEKTDNSDKTLLSKIKEYISNADKAYKNIQKEYIITIEHGESNGYKYKAEAKDGFLLNKIIPRVLIEEEIKDRYIQYTKNITFKIFKPKKIKIVVAGCNSSGAIITSQHILDLTLGRDDYLYFNRKILRSEFLKEVKMIDNSIPMYRFNIRVYDRHELNIDKTLSNYNDLFVQWYNALCLEANEPAVDLEAVSDLATKLFDEEWCSIDHLY